ncbi:MAG: CPBP family intramembrane glutamic endopeptidase [Halobacteriota archaeon]
MRERYVVPLGIVGGLLSIAAGIGPWPDAIPVVADVAALPVGLGALLIVLGLVRFVGGPRSLALLVGLTGLLAVATGIYGYWAHLAEASAALWAALVLVLGGALGTVAALGDWLGIAPGAAKRKSVGAAIGALLGFGGLFMIFVWANLLAILAYALVVGEPSEIQLIVVSQVSLGLGTATVAAVYIGLTDRGWDYIDVRLPSLRGIGWVVAGVIGLLAILIAAGQVLTLVDVPQPEHGIVEVAEGNPDVLLVLIPASLLIIGPGEELLFRNIVQKSLYDHFSTPGAIVVASIIFGLAHFLAYGATASTGGVLLVITLLSLLLGAIYARTGNVVIPAIIHGLYNAVLFASLYVELTTGSGGLVVGLP